MTTSLVPSPEDYVACKSWQKRCLLVSERRQSELCSLLGVKPAGLEMALLEARTYGMTHQVRQAMSQWMDSENELAHAMSLVDTAEAIHVEKAFKELDE
jgi:hypothetical protein